jgi:phosphoglycolate phosphatase-like HAD superfamily hydrolase
MARHVALIFDLDGTLIDSDDALIDPFVRLGMARDEITFGHPIEEACAEWGIDIDRYIELYDTAVAQPFEGADEVVRQLGRWAICSNKHTISGREELARLGWAPEQAWFSSDFGGAAKRLAPVIEAMGLGATDVAYVGDTEHDQACAEAVGCEFYWSRLEPAHPRTRHRPRVLDTPERLLALVG